MSFLPLYRDKEHKYKNGSWSWDEGETTEQLKFTPQTAEKKTDDLTQSLNSGLNFREEIDVEGEKIFLEKFQRKPLFYDSEVVTLQDVKNLALFLLESKVSKKFVEFVHEETFDKFLRNVIFYFEFFLIVLEFLLIRRDQELKGRSRDTMSLKVEQFMSKQLSDRRLLIAREYSKVETCANLLQSLSICISRFC